MYTNFNSTMIVIIVVIVALLVIIGGLVWFTDKPTDGQSHLNQSISNNTTGYLGVVDTGYDKLLLNTTVTSLDKVNYNNELCENTYTIELSGFSETPHFSYAVYGSTIFYGVKKQLHSININTGEEHLLWSCEDNCTDIFVCGSYIQNSVPIIVIITVKDSELCSKWFDNLYYYRLDTNSVYLKSTIPNEYSASFTEYLTSDNNYAYFARFINDGKLYKLDLKTGKFSNFVQNPKIVTNRVSKNIRSLLANEMNRAIIFRDYLYFMISGNKFGLYRAHIESGELEKYFKSGFDGEIVGFCFENSILYTVVQSADLGEQGYPNYRGTYAVYTIDTETGDFRKISKDAVILDEVRGITVEGNKALVYGSDTTFIDLNI